MDTENVGEIMVDKRAAPQGMGPEGPASIDYIRFFRAIDCIIAGIIMLICLLSLKRMFDVLPVPFIQYFYVIAAYLIFYGAMWFPQSGFKLFLYNKSLMALKWSSFVVLLLSPFLHWWSQDPERTYLLMNFMGLCIASAIMIVCISNLAYAVAREDNLILISWMSRISRLAALYLMLAPVIAFFVTVIFGKCSGQDIFLFIVKVERWQLLIFLFPVVLSLATLMQLRYAKYRKLK